MMGEDDNLLIHADNIVALKALEGDYTSKVKCIYIDPPYNTKNRLKHYKDNLEHSEWLNMMKDRLIMMHKLLREDGTIWISIDDDECHYLKVLCDEIFSRKNFVANVMWEKKYSSQNDAKWLSANHDHILVYAKNKDIKQWGKEAKRGLNLLPRTAEMDSPYKNPDNDPKGPWRTGDVRNPAYRKNLIYNLLTPSGKTIAPPPNGWRWSKETTQRKIKTGEIVFRNNDTTIIRKIYLSNQDGIVAKTIWPISETDDNQEATRGLNLLPRSSAMNARYKNPDDDPRGPWMADNLTVRNSRDQRPNQYYAIVDPETENKFWANPRRVWRYIPESMNKLIKENRIIFPKDPKHRPSLKRFLNEVQDGIVAKTIWYRTEVGDNAQAKREIIALNSNDVFSTPKPERLLERIIHLATKPGDLVLDAFAGSGTTGAVAHKMKRRWIMIEMEKTCHTHIIPRMTKVIDGKDPGGITEQVGWHGGGHFLYLELSLLEKKD